MKNELLKAFETAEQKDISLMLVIAIEGLVEHARLRRFQKMTFSFEANSDKEILARSEDAKRYLARVAELMTMPAKQALHMGLENHD